MTSRFSCFPTAVIAIATGLLLAACVRGGEAPRRAAERQVRANLLKNLPEARKKALGAYLNALAGLGQWLIAEKGRTEAEKIVAEISAIDEQFVSVETLKKGLAELPVGAGLDGAKQKDYATRLKSAQRSYISGLLDLARTYYNAGLPRTALEAVQQVLDADPDNPTARQALAQVKTGDTWRDAFSAAQAQRGLVYVKDSGWVAAGAAERVKNGEWHENGRWMSLADANKLHAALASPWVVETAHYTIKSTAPRQQTVLLAERLEALYELCNREFLEYFVRGAEKKGQMAFSHVPAKKLNVLYFGSRTDYETTIKKDFKPPIQTLLLLMPGVYLTFNHTFYFTQGGLPAEWENIFLQHEGLKQILAEYGPGNSVQPRAWMYEGLPEVLQYADLDAGGRMVLPPVAQHPALVGARAMFQEGSLPKLNTLMALPDAAFNAEPLRGRHIQASCSLCMMVLSHKERVLALDFLDFALDSFKNPKPGALEDYIGMDLPALEKEFHEFLGGAK